MSYGKPDRAREGSRRPAAWAITAALVFTVPVVWLIVTAVDTDALAVAWRTVLDHPAELIIALAAFGGAFLFRALAWTRVLPDLGLAHAWAGLHVALGGNHLLPLRLGEPLRVVSVVRRAGIDWQRATASTVTLRAADLLAIGLIGTIAGIGAFSAWWAITGVVLVAGSLVVAGVLWLRRLGRHREISLPGPIALGATVLAWAFEAVVVHQAAGWVGVNLSFGGAVVVTSAAVVAQVAAFAPGGLGTYEMGGLAAMLSLGVDPAMGLAAVVSAHAVKSAYSLAVGLVAALAPAPGMLGRLRLGEREGSGPGGATTPRREQPVVLFIPAHNESASVAHVVSRVPERVRDHPVLCLVIDDGSTDDTGGVAEAAGATVISLGENRGLGAAVRVGLEEALRYRPAAIAFCDADGEYSPEELETMVLPILEGRADYVVGSRFAGEIERMHSQRRVGNLLLTWLLSWVARRRITDGQSGYRAFSPVAAATAEVIHDFNYAQVLTLDLLAKGMRYAEVPISYRFRTTGRSFIRLGRYLRAVLPAVYRELNTV